MSQDGSFLFDPRRFWGDSRVRMMNGEEGFLYFRLLCLQWENGDLPTDPDELACQATEGRRFYTAESIAGDSKHCLSPAKASLMHRLSECFETVDGDDSKMRNPFMHETRERWREVQKQRSEAGRKGGLKSRKPSKTKEKQAGLKPRLSPAEAKGNQGKGMEGKGREGKRADPEDTESAPEAGDAPPSGLAHDRSAVPGFHYCPEWDMMSIDSTFPEWDACQCQIKKDLSPPPDPAEEVNGSSARAKFRTWHQTLPKKDRAHEAELMWMALRDPPEVGVVMQWINAKKLANWKDRDKIPDAVEIIEKRLWESTGKEAMPPDAGPADETSVTPGASPPSDPEGGSRPWPPQIAVLLKKIPGEQTHPIHTGGPIEGGYAITWDDGARFCQIEWREARGYEWFFCDRGKDEHEGAEGTLLEAATMMSEYLSRLEFGEPPPDPTGGSRTCLECEGAAPFTCPSCHGSGKRPEGGGRSTGSFPNPSGLEAGGKDKPIEIGDIELSKPRDTAVHHRREVDEWLTFLDRAIDGFCDGWDSWMAALPQSKRKTAWARVLELRRFEVYWRTHSARDILSMLETAGRREWKSFKLEWWESDHGKTNGGRPRRGNRMFPNAGRQPEAEQRRLDDLLTEKC